ncbi:MAG TPA: RNA-binding protein [Cytophagales bacterium]|nr:RNA-binding protein [Cytophagales bacterium]
MDIFVGSLPFKLKETQLRELFEKYGEVVSAKIIIDKISRQNKGFGFVEMPDEAAALAAIKELNGTEVEGRAIVVSKSEKKDVEKKAFLDRNKGGNKPDRKFSNKRSFSNEDRKKRNYKGGKTDL